MKKLHCIIVLIVLLPGVVCGKKYIPINLEYAVTAEQRVWGLMQRKDLPQDHGMLFIYPRPQKLKFWMFNCLIDLSIAFLDNNSVITEIQHLKAYPEMMDLERPVINLEDLDKYSYNDPILRFFQRNQISSSQQVQYGLEMRANWFKKHGVKVGDRLFWDRHSPVGYIIVRGIE